MSSRNSAVRVQKSSDHGVIIPAHEVIKAGFGIIVIPAIAEGVSGAKGGGHGAGDRLGIAPGVVGVGHDGRAAGIDQSHDIALQIVNVVVCIAFVLETNTGRTMVQEIEGVASGSGLRNQLRPVPGVGGLHAVYGFGQPCSVAAIGIAYTRGAFL